jgi:hypothetical protein
VGNVARLRAPPKRMRAIVSSVHRGQCDGTVEELVVCVDADRKGQRYGWRNCRLTCFAVTREYVLSRTIE